jgi:methionyl aminopeptidase
MLALRAAGRVVAEALAAMQRAVRPGVTTEQLDAIGGRVFAKRGARSAPQITYQFPGINCISVNDQAVHGVPSNRYLLDGDLVKLDVTAELDGFMADAAVTVAVGKISTEARRLIETAERALVQALGVARAGTRLNGIGRAIQEEVESAGFFVIPQLGGHGIGRTLHEPPSVPNYFVETDDTLLSEGLVITIEPIIAAGTSRARGPAEDGWTMATADGSLSAHVEHTIVVTRNSPIVLTAAA